MAARNRKATVRLTMGQALVKFLSVQYSSRDGGRRRLVPGIFGIFGHGNLSGLGQALVEYGADLPYHHAWNEQSMVHTACGFAKANHRLATLACTASIGPGSTNMITGAATATINRLPVLLFPSDYYVTRRQGAVLQQLEHPISADVSVNDCFRPVSRFFDRISRPEQLLTALPEAMRVLTDPADTGAVTLALPQDLQTHAHDYPAHFFDERTWHVERRPPESRRIAEAVKLLKSAKRPVIIAGGGIHYSEAWDELQAFAESFGVPVGETFAGRGAIRRESSLLLGGHGVTGNPAAATIVKKADLVISIGTRLSDFTTGSQSAFGNPDVNFIGISVHAHDAHKQGALAIVADAREALRALTRAARAAGIKPGRAYVKEIAAARERWARQLARDVDQPVAGEAMSQGKLIRVINEEAKAGDTIVAAAGLPPGDLHKLWDATRGATCHLEFGYSCMGYELPASVGVRMARHAGEVYALLGDGTYMLNPSDILTALQEKVKITAIVSENHGYQSIHQLQMGRVGHTFGTQFRQRDSKTRKLEGSYLQIDFVQNAESLGAAAWHVRTPEELRAALREAREETRCCVIVAETERHRYLPGSDIWWDIPVAEVTHDPVTRRLRAEHERGAARHSGSTIKRDCKSRCGPPSGHGFNRADQMSPSQRLQPLRANDAPQGLKPSPLRVSIGPDKSGP